MTYPRSPRVVDQNVIEAVKARDVYCLVCGRMPMAEPHHIKSRGAHGPDAPWNLIMLCGDCHRAAHSGGLSREYLFGLLKEWYGYDIPDPRAG